MGPVARRVASDPLGDQEKQQIREAIREKYKKVSSTASGRFKYATGKEGAMALAYDHDLLKEMPEELLASFCGVGNPFSLGEITKGDDILDIGCGAGFDLYVARQKTGETGRVAGVDLTAEMLDKARSNLARLGQTDIETHLVEGEKLPFGDHSFDLVISNGVINLSPAKEELFAEIYRVLRPGGKVQIADMVLEKELPPQLASSLEAWSQ